MGWGEVGVHSGFGDIVPKPVLRVSSSLLLPQ